MSAPLTAGVCRFCGCTEGDACDGGCAWTDDSRTLWTVCVTIVGLVVGLIKVVGIAAAAKPRPASGPLTFAWDALDLETQCAVVAMFREYLETVHEEIAEEILDEAFSEVRAIAAFLDERCPQEFARGDEEGLAAVVIRLLTPHVGSRLVGPDGARL